MFEDFEILDFEIGQNPPDDYEILARIIERHGDEGVTAIEMLMQIFRIGKQRGAHESYNEGYLKGVSDTQAKMLTTLQESSTVSTDTPIIDLVELDARARMSLVRDKYIRADKQRQFTTLGDILLTPAKDLFEVRNFGATAGKHLAEFLLSIGYTDKAKEIGDCMQVLFKA